MNSRKTAGMFCLVVGFTMLSASAAFAQFPNLLSMIKSGGEGSQSALAVGVGLDASTNAYVFGTFETEASFGDSILANSASHPNIFVAKFNAPGSALVAPTPAWALAPVIDSPPADLRFGVHAFGGAVLAGTFGGTNVAFGSIEITNASPGVASDVFLGKYDGAGNALWLTRFGGAEADFCGDLAVDLGGNNYLAGSFQSSSFSAGNATLNKESTSEADSFIIKTGANGNVLWARQGTHASAKLVALDPQNNCYVAGLTTGDSLFDGVSPANPVTGQFVTKYSSAGAVLWSRGDMKIGERMVVDRAQSIISAGAFSGIAQFGSITLTNEASAALFVVKYDSAGNPLWASQLPGFGNDEVTGMLVGASTNYWITGSFASSDEGGNRINPRMFLACLDQDGNLLGVGHASGDGPSAGNGLATFQGGIDFLCGTFSGELVFGGRALASTGTSDILLARIGAPPPIIKTTVSEGNLIQSWTDPLRLGFGPEDTFSLEASADLSGWSPSPNSPVLENGQYVVTNSVSGEAMFFRLRK